MVVLAACKSADDGIVVTPPIAPAEDTAVPPTAPVAPTNTATAVPSTPTPQPTNQPTSTPTITPTPTNTPIPESPVTSINLVPVANGFVKPVYLTHAGDNRLFVVEQDGTIRIIQDGAVLPQPFLNIDPLVGSGGSEQGLLSVAFHPEYGENGRFFVYYTDNNGGTVVARYQVSADDPNQANPDSALILLTLPQPFSNHNGGLLKFGPDGYLYVGLGDGGSANDPLKAGQDTSTLLGKILRLDVDFNESGYAIPADNPFVDDEAARNEIWAYGLRNPWRFSFDRLTGDLYIADVGQNIWEEVDFQPVDSTGGENYGWNIMEGTHCFQADTCDQTGLVLPVVDYQHLEGNCSVTGGYVYRGQQFLSLYGNYFYGDYCSGKIWSLLRQPDGTWINSQVYGRQGLLIPSFGEDVNGELYLLSYGDGVVYQIQP
ncbi:MAG: PQQ-dependent sugar dehydrogenase [Ardenticatenaceae bacterium]|nr:PQQ-dependent sugar dehydrogenase [Ardenticatenaceae bacterium]MCB9445555.1 PQQ-dependent sugar dehydrogenase [Ardenticatenaceae bacterium]